MAKVDECYENNKGIIVQQVENSQVTTLIAMGYLAMVTAMSVALCRTLKHRPEPPMVIYCNSFTAVCTAQWNLNILNGTFHSRVKTGQTNIYQGGCKSQRHQNC